MQTLASKTSSINLIFNFTLWCTPDEHLVFLLCDGCSLQKVCIKLYVYLHSFSEEISDFTVVLVSLLKQESDVFPVRTKIFTK